MKIMLMSGTAFVLLGLTLGWVSSGEKKNNQPAPPAKSKADDLFALDKVWTFHLHISAKDWEAMQPKGGPNFGMFPGPGGPKAPEKPDDNADIHKANGTGNLTFPWVHAEFTAGGKTYKNVGVRYKGNFTYMMSANQLRRSLKIDLDHYDEDQRFLGQKKLNLSSGVTDTARLRESLSFAVFRAAGVPAPRTAFAEITLTVPGKYDKEYVGVYTLIEQVGNTFLKEHFKSAKGLLLKPEGLQGGLQYLGEDWQPYEKRYLPKDEASKKQQKRLIDFARLVNKAGDEQFQKEIVSFLDVDQFLRFVAANALLANLDSFLGFGHNFYLYLRPDNNKFVFMPWDLDLSLGMWPPGGPQQQQADLSINHPHMGQNKLIDRLLAMKDVNEKYQKVVKELTETCFAKEKLLKDIDAVEKAIKEPLAKEKKAATARKEGGGGFGFGAPGGGMFVQTLSMQSFVAKRTESVLAQLAGKSKGYTPAGFGMPGGFGPPGGGGPGKFGLGAMLAKPAFKAADTDSDGKVSLEEARTAVKKFFQECDKDKKGMLDEKMVAEGINRSLPPPPGFGGGKPPAGFGPGNFLAKPLLKAAGAKDNKVSLDDLLAATDRLFKEWDKDKNGSLSESELTDGLNQLFAPPPGAFPFPGGGPGLPGGPPMNPPKKGDS